MASSRTSRRSVEILAAPQPDMAALGEVAARYGLQMDQPSVPRLIAEHGLSAG